MDMGYEHKIRERAYAIWMAAGMIEGAAEQHWLHAEATLRNEAEVPAPPESKHTARKPAKATAIKATAVKTAAKPVKAKPAGTAGRKARSAAALEAGA